MTMTIYDSHGVKVDPHSTTFCTNCGQLISNVAIWHGMPYGPDCYEFVSGQNYADYRRKATRSPWRVAKDAWDAEHSAFRVDYEPARIAAVNEHFAVIIHEMLGQPHGGWAWSIADKAKQFGQLPEIDSRAWDILASISAKDRGRKGSKAYALAEDQFYARVETAFTAFDSSLESFNLRREALLARKPQWADFEGK